MDEEKMTDEKFEALTDKAAKEYRACIVIFQDADGNWRGGYAKDGVKSLGADAKNPSIFTRQVGPETVLQMLLTHDGK